ncbi:MAG: DsbA family protein [Candidatus Aenigmarchaeota archaeon]|nr:DsbA family protein [Candidatus Aenigmarchaeota archaeon]
MQITVLYFTDPWCAWCWASEPNIMRLREEYGKQIQIVFKMGGLLEDMGKFYGSGKIPISDIANHLRSVSRQSGMPINEETVLEDPPNSTWPSNVAYKAAEFQGEAIGERYLRRLREAAFLEGLNISKRDVLEALAASVGVDMEKFRDALDTGKAEIAFREDLRECEDRKIKGFPTLVFKNPDGQEISLIGYRKFEEYENTIDRLTEGEISKVSTSNTESFIKKYKRITTVELAEVFQYFPTEAAAVLEELVKKGLVKKHEMRSGNLWEYIGA